MRHDTDTPTERQPEPATSTTRATTATAERRGTGSNALTTLPEDERTDARRRWEDIEARFVDDPAGATRAADDLLGDVMDRISRRFQDHRRGLRDGWDRDDASTEELRTTLKRYRGSLEQLLGG